LKILKVIFLYIISISSWAYPNYIGYGYNSCLTCHYNPHGNGPLTDYGRAVSATVISDRSIWEKDVTEDEIGERSGFMYQKPFSSWLRPSLNYRGLALKKNIDDKQSETEIIHMMANVNVVAKFGENDKYYASGTFGYAPTPRGNKDSDEENYRTREAYVGMRVNENWGLYAGLMDKIFGIRVADHIAFSRTMTGLTMNDQSQSLSVHYTRPEFEAGAQYFFGNPTQDSELRQVGFTTQMEYTLGPKTRLGGSFLTSESEHLSNTMFSFHGRWGFDKGSSILAEFGQVTKTPVVTEQDFTSRYLFFQNHVLLRRGTFYFTTIEFLWADVEKDDKVMRIGPGFQYFPFQGLELRFDLYNSRVFSEKNYTKDTWSFAGQVHLWL
jgi:hypothetical protein